MRIRTLTVGAAILLALALAAPAAATPPSEPENSCVAGLVTTFTPTFEFEGQTLNFGAFAKFAAQTDEPNLGQNVKATAHTEPAECPFALAP
jgi:hypothetical protein